MGRDASHLGRSGFALAAAAVGVFILPGIAKLMPAQIAEEFPRRVATALAIVELVIGGALFVPAWRLRAATVATAYLIGAVGYTLLSLYRVTPTCGCFGGWVVLKPWVRLSVLGTGIALLGCVRPTRFSADGPERVGDAV